MADNGAKKRVRAQSMSQEVVGLTADESAARALRARARARKRQKGKEAEHSVEGDEESVLAGVGGARGGLLDAVAMRAALAEGALCDPSALAESPRSRCAC